MNSRKSRKVVTPLLQTSEVSKTSEVSCNKNAPSFSRGALVRDFDEMLPQDRVGGKRKSASHLIDQNTAPVGYCATSKTLCFTKNNSHVDPRTL
jgi:hypothetical protein